MSSVKIDIGRKRKKRNKKLFKFTLITSIIAAAFLFVFFFFKTSEITYEGNNKSNEEELNEYIFDGRKPNTLIYSIFGNKKKEIPFISDYDVNIVWPNKIHVVVHEKELLASFYYAGVYEYIDETGNVVDSSCNLYDNAPLIEGISFDNLILGSRPHVSDEKAYNALVLYAHFARTYSLKFNKIIYKDGAIFYQINNAYINMGTTEHAEEKVFKLSKLYNKIEGLSGTLHLEDYDGGNKNIIFEKTVDNSNGESSEESKSGTDENAQNAQQESENDQNAESGEQNTASGEGESETVSQSEE